MTRPSPAHVAMVTVISALAACSLLVASACPETGAASQPDSVIRQPRVALVRVSPESVTVPQGALAVVEATVTDGQDSVLRNRRVVSTSDHPDIATVNEAVLITGVAPGFALISAINEGVMGRVGVTVAEPVASPWPHEPVGFRTIENQAWNLLHPANWVLQWGTASIVPDLSAPFSPPATLQITYSVGFVGGEAPGTFMIEFPARKQLYIGTWWKPSDPWQGHPSNVNKIQFLFFENSPNSIVMYGSPGGPYEARPIIVFPDRPPTWYVPNVRKVPVSLGGWHFIEWLLVYNTSDDPANGLMWWWLDGELIGDYTDIRYPSMPIGTYKISPIWGGIGEIKNETDFFRYDHVRISGR